MGYLANFYRDSYQKELEKMAKKSQKQHLDTMSRSPGYRVKVARDVIESVEIGEIYGFFDVTGNFEVDFRAIGWLYLGAASEFSSFFLALSDGYFDKKIALNGL